MCEWWSCSYDKLQTHSAQSLIYLWFMPVAWLYVAPASQSIHLPLFSWEVRNDVFTLKPTTFWWIYVPVKSETSNTWSNLEYGKLKAQEVHRWSEFQVAKPENQIRLIGKPKWWKRKGGRRTYTWPDKRNNKNVIYFLWKWHWLIFKRFLVQGISWQSRPTDTLHEHQFTGNQH